MKNLVIFLSILIIVGCKEFNPNSASVSELRNEIEDLRSEARKLNNTADEYEQILAKQKNSMESINDPKISSKIVNNVTRLKPKSNANTATIFTNKVFTDPNSNLNPVIYKLSNENGKLYGSSKLLTEDGYVDAKLIIEQDDDQIILKSIIDNKEIGKFTGNLVNQNNTNSLVGEWKTHKGNLKLQTHFQQSDINYNSFTQKTGRDIWKKICAELNSTDSKYGPYCNAVGLIYDLVEEKKDNPDIKKPFQCNKQLPISCEVQKNCHSIRPIDRTIIQKNCCATFESLEKAYKDHRDNPNKELRALEYLKYTYRDFSENCEDSEFLKLKSKFSSLTEGKSRNQIKKLDEIDIELDGY